MDMTKAAFCGSFDPVTVGHIDLIERAAPLFEELIVFVSVNSAKREGWPVAVRKRWIEEAVSHLDNVRVEVQNGLSAEACQKAGAKVLLRGIRTNDADYEANMAYVNRIIDPEIETLCMFASSGMEFISSSNVREMLRYHVSIKGLVPDSVLNDLEPQSCHGEIKL